jgi:hypothetical protein
MESTTEQYAYYHKVLGVDEALAAILDRRLILTSVLGANLRF